MNAVRMCLYGMINYDIVRKEADVRVDYKMNVIYILKTILVPEPSPEAHLIFSHLGTETGSFLSL